MPFVGWVLLYCLPEGFLSYTPDGLCSFFGEEFKEFVELRVCSSGYSWSS